MCIAFVYFQPNAPKGSPRFILADNRDEYYARETVTPHIWSDGEAHPGDGSTGANKIFAARDGVGGGTWLGVGEHGRIAVLTNYRDGSVALAPLRMSVALMTVLTPVMAYFLRGAVAQYTSSALSASLILAVLISTLIGLVAYPFWPHNHVKFTASRGVLVRDFLQGDMTAGEYANWLVPRGRSYAGFNLFIYDGKELWYYSNSGGAADNALHLRAGIYAVSNAIIDVPWRKITRGKEIFAECLRKHSITSPTTANSNNNTTSNGNSPLLQPVILKGGRNCNGSSRDGSTLSSSKLSTDLMNKLLCDPTPSDIESIHKYQRTGFPQFWELYLSSIQVQPRWVPWVGVYGTRSSTVIIDKGDGILRWREATLDTKGFLSHGAASNNYTTRHWLLALVTARYPHRQWSTHDYELKTAPLEVSADREFPVV